MRRLLAIVDREAANFAVIEGYATEYRKIPVALSTVGGWVPILQRPLANQGRTQMTHKRNIMTLLSAILLAGCAGMGLGDVIQAPHFSVARGRNAELRLTGPTLQSPLGGATVPLWANVRNPNPLGLALAALDGSLALEGTRAANVSFPLGVPLLANQDTIIPLD